MFTTDLQDEIVKQSNLYAKEVMGEEKYSRWTQITREELQAYFGFCILMGINHLPALDDYWSTDPTLHYSGIASRITRDRFRELSHYLHFADNATLAPREDPGYDRLGMVRAVIDHLSSRFSYIYDPQRGSCRRGDDQVHRSLNTKAIYATETCEERDQSVGTCGQP